MRFIPFFIPAKAEIKAKIQITKTNKIISQSEPAGLETRWLIPPSICVVPRPTAATNPKTVVRMVIKFTPAGKNFTFFNCGKLLPKRTFDLRTKRL